MIPFEELQTEKIPIGLSLDKIARYFFVDYRTLKSWLPEGFLDEIGYQPRKRLSPKQTKLIIDELKA